MRLILLFLIFAIAPASIAQDSEEEMELSDLYETGEVKKCIKYGENLIQQDAFKEKAFPYLVLGRALLEFSLDNFKGGKYPNSFYRAIECASTFSKLDTAGIDREPIGLFFDELELFVCQDASIALDEEDEPKINELLQLLSQISALDNNRPMASFFQTACLLTQGKMKEYFDAYDIAHAYASKLSEYSEVELKRKESIKNAGILLSLCCLDKGQKSKGMLIAGKLKEWLPSDEDIMGLFSAYRE